MALPLTFGDADQDDWAGICKLFQPHQPTGEVANHPWSQLPWCMERSGIILPSSRRSEDQRPDRPWLEWWPTSSHSALWTYTMPSRKQDKMSSSIFVPRRSRLPSGYVTGHGHHREWSGLFMICSIPGWPITSTVDNHAESLPAVLAQTTMIQASGPAYDNWKSSQRSSWMQARNV